MSHDTHCHDLAELFLDEEPQITEADVNDLAETIQASIEGWLDGRTCKTCGSRMAIHFAPCHESPSPADKEQK